jgi:hypothetical protein
MAHIAWNKPFGDFKLYYPGLNSPLDIISTNVMRGAVSKAQAYKIITMSYPELARATSYPSSPTKPIKA